MKIAFVVPYVPNKIRTRPYNLILQLSALGHDIDVFTVGNGESDRVDVESLRSKCRNVYFYHQPLWRSLLNSGLAVLSDKPLQSVYSLQPELVKRLKTINRDRLNNFQYDVVHVEHLRGSAYGVYLKSHLPSLPLVWDSVDCISHLFQQASGQSRGFFGKLITRFELSRTRKAEGNLVCNFDHVLVTSSTDKNALLDLVTNGKKPSPISVVPNGVDLDYFHFNPDIPREAATIVFSGKMSYHANISMATFLVSEIMPRVWKAHPKTKLYIVGKDPSLDIKKMEKNPLITVTGTVEDIRPFLWRATVSVVPLLYGAGIQNKILEAMATGTPVITTSRALTALQVHPGKDLLVANDAESFAREILHLIDDKNLNRAIGHSGLTYVRSKHNWTSAASQVADIYRHSKELSSNFLS
jgi:polysaccharide biosynthesis protein PslH